MKHAVIALLALVACNENKTPATAEERGAKVYFASCVACHNADPKKDGTIGPAIAGSSRALVEARVLTATYPEGYKPKRDTKTMVALPYLKASLDDLTAFLNSPAPH